MRKPLIVLAAGLVAVVVLLLAADRISVAVAENQISDRLTSAYGLPAKPGVSITGFPFLTQVAAGDYQQIDVSANQVPANGTTLHDLNVRLTGVHATVSQVLGSGSSMVTADHAAGSAMVGFGTVDQRLPHGFRIHRDGKNLSVSGHLAFHGVRIPVSATVALGVSGTGISVTPVRVNVAGLPGLSVSAYYSSRLRVVVPLSTLPLHLHLTAVHVTPNGLRIAASARHVQFART
jgi:LmeA-like phospholipid-binding